MADTEFVYVSQELDGQEAVVRVPQSSLATWLPRGWSVCEPPARPVRPDPEAAVEEEPPVEPPVLAETPSSKKAEPSASGPEPTSEGTD